MSGSLFHLAAVSKRFIVTAIVHPVERGNVTLEVPATVYLAYVRLIDLRSTAVSIQQLLSHTSEMPDEVECVWAV